MTDTLATSWLDLQCRMLPGVVRGVAALHVPADGGIHPSATWPDDAAPASELISVAELAARRKSPVVVGNDGTSDSPTLDVGYPLLREGEPFGVVAVEVQARLGQQAAIIQVLRWGAAWLELLLRNKANPSGARRSTVVEVVAAALGQVQFRASATAVATQLAHQLGCERVSIGVVRRRTMHLVAFSDTASFDARANLVRGLETAMEEALDQDTTIVYPSVSPAQESVTNDHARLVEKAGNAAICTVLIKDGNRIVGALTLERFAGSAFDEASIAHCESVAALVGPILEMKRLQDRAPLIRFRDGLHGLAARLAGPGNWSLKLWLATVVAGAAFLAFATGEYRLGAPATLEGVVHAAVVAPYDGFISAAGARAGEAVSAGEVLAELDDRDLRLQHRKWVGEREEINKQYRKALANLDHSEARILRAQIAQTETQISLVDEQLTRARLVAPFSGVIVTGDLSRSLGIPVERGQVLFEVAPLDAYRVALEVDDRDIADIRVGQRGLLTLSAMPGERLPLVVENVSSISETEAGRAAFRVEARLSGSAPLLRPGMQGVAKITAGQRKLAWIWTRRLTGWARLWLWSWLP